MSELYHHGILGQKWGVRRYQNKDGSLTALGKEHYYGDIHYKTGRDFYRYSNKKETGPLQGSYVMHTPHDIGTYYMNAKHAELGFKNYDKIYMTNIKTLDKVTIRRGKAVLNDMLDEFGDKELSTFKSGFGKKTLSKEYKMTGKEAYDMLNKAGYFDKRAWKDRDKIRQQDEEHQAAVMILGKLVNNSVYKQKGKSFIEKYKDMGYDAIIDPEDYIYNYNSPMIIINGSKFKRTKTGVVYNKSYKEYMDELKTKKKDWVFTEEENAKLKRFTNKK